MIVPDFDEKTALLVVFDGHGGIYASHFFSLLGGGGTGQLSLSAG